MDSSDFITPNEMMEHAKEIALDGKEPKTRDDWVKIINVVAYNVEPTVAHTVCELFRVLYMVPLSDSEVRAIATYQIRSKLGKSLRSVFSTIMEEINTNIFGEIN